MLGLTTMRRRKQLQGWRGSGWMESSLTELSRPWKSLVRTEWKRYHVFKNCSVTGQLWSKGLGWRFETLMWWEIWYLTNIQCRPEYRESVHLKLKRGELKIFHLGSNIGQKCKQTAVGDMQMRVSASVRNLSECRSQPRYTFNLYLWSLSFIFIFYLYL